MMFRANTDTWIIEPVESGQPTGLYFESWKAALNHLMERCDRLKQQWWVAKEAVRKLQNEGEPKAGLV